MLKIGEVINIICIDKVVIYPFWQLLLMKQMRVYYTFPCFIILNSWLIAKTRRRSCAVSRSPSPRSWDSWEDWQDERSAWPGGFSGVFPRSKPWPLLPRPRPLRSRARSRRRSSRPGATRGTGPPPPRRRSPTPPGSTPQTRSTPPTPSRRTTTMRTRRRSSRRHWKSGQFMVMCLQIQSESRLTLTAIICTM